MKDKKYNKLCHNLNNRIITTIEKFLDQFKMIKIPEISREVIGAVFLRLIIHHYQHHYDLTPKNIESFTNYIRDSLFEIMEEKDDDFILPSNKINGEYEVLEDLGAEA